MGNGSLCTCGLIEELQATQVESALKSETYRTVSYHEADSEPRPRDQFCVSCIIGFKKQLEIPSCNAVSGPIST